MRNMTQRRVLDLVIKNWHRNAPFTESVNSTAGFLWLLVMVLIFGSCAAAIVAGWEQFEDHPCHGASAGANVEQAHCLDAEQKGRGVGHVAHGGPANGGGA